MKRFSQLAAAAVLATCGTALVSVAPAVAKDKEQAAAKPAQRSFKLSDDERKALSALEKAVNAKDMAAATAALPAAQAAAQSPDAKYVVGRFQIIIGTQTQNKALQSQGLDAMIASGSATPEELPDLYLNQAAFAEQAKDAAKEEAALNSLLKLRPNDEKALLGLAYIRANQKRIPEALTMMDQAIQAKKAAGQPVPEDWYTFAVAKADQAHLNDQLMKFSRDWVAAYPNAKSWRPAFVTVRRAITDKSIDVDALRAMRAAKAMASENDYYQLAWALSQTGYPGETKAVLDEGVAAHIVDGGKPPFSDLRASANSRVAADRASLPSAEKSAMAAASGTPALKLADAYYGYGDYAKAITLYRAALQKGGVDANLVNTRLGLALAQSGQKAEAQAAFKSVTGPRAQLASLLVLWLDHQA